MCSFKCVYLNHENGNRNAFKAIGIKEYVPRPIQIRLKKESITVHQWLAKRYKRHTLHLQVDQAVSMCFAGLNGRAANHCP